MEINEAEFARIIRENKGTIYTVCYMFSKDKEEVEQERLEDMDLQGDLELLYLHRPQEEEPQDSTAHGGHRPV